MGMKPQQDGGRDQAKDRAKGSLKAALHGAYPIEPLVQDQHGGCGGPIGAFEARQRSDRPCDQGSRPDAQGNARRTYTPGQGRRDHFTRLKKERRSSGPAGAPSLGDSATRDSISRDSAFAFGSRE